MPETSAFQRALERAGTTIGDVREASAAGRAVRDSNELRRIVAISRRSVSLEALSALADELTQAFKNPTGTMRLRPLQAQALAEAFEQRGLVGAMPVGSGKTLVTYLLPSLFESERPLLLLPGALVEKTRREFRVLRQHWAGMHPDAYPIQSYEFLAHPAQGASPDGSKRGWLERFQPTMIVMDEAHRAKNLRSITAKRLRRFLETHPVPVIVLSGTLTRKSLRDFAHLADWALRQSSPVPTRYTDVEQWASALDERVMQRTKPGALAALANATERAAIARCGAEATGAARSAVSRRMAETAGFVAASHNTIGSSLVIAPVQAEGPDPAVDAAFVRLREFWESPGGEQYADGLAVSRCARQLALGMYYRWIDPPPKSWREARKGWGSWAHETLTDNRRGIDSEVHLIQAVKQGLYDDHGLHNGWLRERDAERARTGHLSPPSEAVWLSDNALQYCAAWLHREKGLVFCEHVHFAERLSQLAGVPYFGQLGLSKTGEALEKHSGAAVVSASANRTGRNLQAWAKALLLTAPEEQLLGRLHREGQEADEVRFDLFIGAAENVDSFWSAVERAKYEAQTLGYATKLTYADVLVVKNSLEYGKGPRWIRSK